jgi:prepilin-type processing-associated H-X9-DG protein
VLGLPYPAPAGAEQPLRRPQAVPVKTYLCPGRGGRTAFSGTGGNFPNIAGPHTDYAINWNSFGNTGVQVTLAGVSNTAGTANVILIGEKAMDPNNYGNPDSSNWDEVIYSGGYGGTGRGDTITTKDRVGNNFGNQWGGPHDGGCQFLMCDGHVRGVPFNEGATTGSFNRTIIGWMLDRNNTNPVPDN